MTLVTRRRVSRLRSINPEQVYVENPWVRRFLPLLPLLVLLPVLQAAPAAAAPSAQPSAFERQVLSYTNAERTKRGLRPLALNTCATYYAKRWAAQLNRNGSLSHQSLSPIMSNCHAGRAGENVAYGNVTPAQLVAMWMRSDGHRANILNPRFTSMGVGAVRNSTGRLYGVQDFLG